MYLKYTNGIIKLKEVKMQITNLLYLFILACIARTLPIMGMEDKNKLSLKLLTIKNTDAAEKLLNAGADPNIQNSSGYTPLMQAAHNNNGRLMTILLDHGALADTQNLLGETALMKVSRPRIVKLLCDKDASPNIQAKNGQTALMLVVQKHNKYTLNAVKALLKCNANPNIQDNNGNTALILTIQKNHPEAKTITEILLQAGADPHIQNNQGKTALSFAQQNDRQETDQEAEEEEEEEEETYEEAIDMQDKNKLSLKLFTIKKADEAERLLNAGADPNILKPKGYTPLMQAVQKRKPTLIPILLERGAFINTQDLNGETALMKTHRAAMVELLCSKGALPNIQAKNGQTALMLAVQRNTQYIVVAIKALLKCGANPNMQDNNGNTAIILTTRKNHPKAQMIVEVLLKAGANLDTQNNQGKTALYFAQQNKCQAIINLLTNQYTNQFLLDTVVYGNADLVRNLLNTSNININAQHISTGYTALMTASAYNHLEIVCTLLNHGANANIQDYMGQTALIWAVKNNYQEIVRILLESGADKTIPEQNGDTPVTLAVKNGFIDIVNILESEPNTNIQNATQSISLILAADGDSENVQESSTLTFTVYDIDVENTTDNEHKSITFAENNPEITEIPFNAYDYNITDQESEKGKFDEEIDYTNISEEANCTNMDQEANYVDQFLSDQILMEK